MEKENIEISVVIPAYNEEQNVGILYKETRAVLDKLNKEYEIIFVDDGSKDKTFEVLEKISEEDKKLKVIQFRRNFGQTSSLDAGFKNASGKLIVVMDADLQNDPKDIPLLVNKIKEGYDVVSGWRYDRSDSFSKRFFSLTANLLRRLVTKDEDIHDAGCALKVYKKECLADLDLFGEMHRFITTILSWKGYNVGEVKVNHRPRKYGKTKYGFKRLVKGFLDLIIIKFWMQYSARPIHIFGGLGLISFFIGMITGLYLVYNKIMLNQSLANRPLLLFSVLLIILGVQLISFGVLADIIIKNYYEKSQKRPYSIKKIIK